MYSEIFEKYSKLIDLHKDLLFQTEKYLFSIPETGYKEYKTVSYLEEQFEKLGYELHKAEGITGFYTTVDTGIPGPCLLILGELDAVICAEHDAADPKTGAVHACGHHCQVSALLGIAAALKQKGALDGLSGKIKLCAVPAEELLETEFREEMRNKGIIKYFGGKMEFLWRGYFDDVDLALMVHTSSGAPHKINFDKSSNGCITKNIVYKGKASHAGGSPNHGINALYAATLGLNAVNALRETVIDNEYGRIHSIITEGGQMVNSIPSTVCIETQVRGATNAVIKRINDKVNRAFASSAAALGAKMEIHDRPGYSPVCNDETMIEIGQRVGCMCTEPEFVIYSDKHGGGCSDIGDLQMVMPALHPYVSGATGSCHASDFRITDPESAVLFSAKFQLVFLHELLKNDAAEAKRVIANAKVPYKTREEYFSVVDSFYKDKEAVIYNTDGTVTLDY